MQSEPVNATFSYENEMVQTRGLVPSSRFGYRRRGMAAGAAFLLHGVPRHRSPLAFRQRHVIWSFSVLCLHFSDAGLDRQQELQEAGGIILRREGLGGWNSP